MEQCYDWWVQGFQVLINSNSPVLDPNIVEELKVWPPCTPLDCLHLIFEVKETIRSMSNRKAFGPDGLQAELFKFISSIREDHNEYSTK